MQTSDEIRAMQVALARRLAGYNPRSVCVDPHYLVKEHFDYCLSDEDPKLIPYMERLTARWFQNREPSTVDPKAQRKLAVWVAVIGRLAADLLRFDPQDFNWHGQAYIEATAIAIKAMAAIDLGLGKILAKMGRANVNDEHSPIEALEYMWNPRLARNQFAELYRLSGEVHRRLREVEKDEILFEQTKALMLARFAFRLGELQDPAHQWLLSIGQRNYAGGHKGAAIARKNNPRPDDAVLAQEFERIRPHCKTDDAAFQEVSKKLGPSKSTVRRAVKKILA